MSETTQTAEQFKLPDLEERLKNFRERSEKRLATIAIEGLDLGVDL